MAPNSSVINILNPPGEMEWSPGKQGSRECRRRLKRAGNVFASKLESNKDSARALMKSATAFLSSARFGFTSRSMGGVTLPTE